MCYAQTPSGGQQWTGNPIDGLSMGLFGHPATIGDKPKQEPAAAPLYPNGPATPVPTIQQPSQTQTQRAAAASPTSSDTGLTIGTQSRQLGGVERGAGLNVPS